MEQVKTAVVNSASQNWSEPEVLALRGVTDQIQQVIPITPSGNTSFNLNWVSPGAGSVISPMVRFRGTMNVVVNWTPTSATAHSAVMAPRAFPFSRLIQSFQVAVNNQTIANSSYGEFAAQLYKYKAGLKESTPQAPVLQDYLMDYALAAGAVSPANVLGTANQCAGGRGGASGFDATGLAMDSTGVAQSSTVTIPFDEVLPLSLFSIDPESPWFYNVNTMSFNFQFSTNYAQLLSLSRPNGITATYVINSITAASTGLFTQPMSITLLTATPNALVPKPSKALYPVEFYDYQTSVAATSFASGDNKKLTSQNITLPAIPKAVYVYAQPAQSDLTALQSDCVLICDSLTITLDSKPVLNNMDRNGLALISAKNGYSSVDRTFVNGFARLTAFASGNIDGYTQTTVSAGIVAPGVYLLMGENIPLPESLVVGSGGSHTMQVEGTFINQSSQTISNVILKVVLIYDQILEISTGAATLQYVNVSPAESVKAGVRAPKEMLGAGLSGGGLVYGRKTYAAAVAGVLSGGGGSGGSASKSSLAQRLKA